MRPWQMVKQKIHWTQWDWHRQEVSMEMWKLLESDGFFKLKERMALQMEMKLEFLMKVVRMMDEKQMTKMNHLRSKKHPQKGTNGIYNQPRGRSATRWVGRRCTTVLGREMKMNMVTWWWFGFNEIEVKEWWWEWWHPSTRSTAKTIGKTMTRRIAMDKAMQMHAERVMSGAEPSSLQALQVPLYLALWMTATISFAVCLWRTTLESCLFLVRPMHWTTTGGIKSCKA